MSKQFFSTVLKEIIQDERLTQSLLKGSSYLGTFESWKESRFFITQTIHKNGSFLDVGCANGFLLKSLQYWSPYHIDPYGIDINQERIVEAQKLFPECPNHFLQHSGENINELSKSGFPEHFDFIYRSYWRPEDLSEARLVQTISSLLEKVKPQGRLILGIYGGNAYFGEKHLEERKRLLYSMNTIKSTPFQFSQIFCSDNNRNHFLTWIDKM